MDNILILDLTVVGLLIATIIYAIILNRKINKLHHSKKEFISIIKHFDQAVAKTEANITEIRNMAGSLNKQIDSKIEHGMVLIDDIDYVSDKGRNVVKAIQSAIDNAKVNIAKASQEQQMEASSASYEPDDSQSQRPHNIIPMKKREKKSEQAQVLEDLMRRISETRSKDDSKGLEEIRSDIMNKFQPSKKQHLHES